MQRFMERETMKTYYWVVINGPSVAMSSLPLPTTLEVRPVPQLLLGFDSAEEASEALHFFLTASIPECKKRLRELARRAKRGEIVNIEPDNPEPPTAGATLWGVAPKARGSQDSEARQ